MPHAIIKRQESPEQLARGKLKNKVPQLLQALEGRVRPHHRFLLTEFLEEWDLFGQRIIRLEEETDSQIRPFERAIAQWQTMPGVHRVTAWCLVVET